MFTVRIIRNTDTVRTSQETHYVSASEPNRLMLDGETVAVYCENHTEHTDTVRTSQEPYGTHRYSPYLTGAIRNTQIQSVPHRNHTEHTDTLCGQKAEFWHVKAGGVYSDHLALKG
jgi:hypothetical protein